ncbi:putative TetR family transcriptional regulator [Caenibius tardaugens NBRC 16725]|uniref:Putative TetR family transcriptional regulator n=1 Tax=Caenibius tardaugens NBRC 16725 TaxID=1219035 RepID=U2ZSV5_9SPHN|nr:TetR/AcrR family transcriptional regulator [Caenibius tardaugens]AZI34910.1 TetR/AcrR family transcriptional regulator [Caenibius tardaugens NBRC 16725]GAD48449.1 putative TetR family transcriptional regulator [Caenibius tardaugens NBRC 16725]
MDRTGEGAQPKTANRRGRPTAEDSRQKTEQLLEVARDMFAQVGYRAVTMRRVAEVAQVSTRTLYDRFSDKLRLFDACMDFSSLAFPRIVYDPAVPIDACLRDFAASLVRMLSSDSSVRMALMVSREGAEFPELVRTADMTQQKHLMLPLATFLREAGLAGNDRDGLARAKLFVALALAEWQRCYTFLHPLPHGGEVESHAELIVDLFLHGIHKIQGDKND